MSVVLSVGQSVGRSVGQSFGRSESQTVIYVLTWQNCYGFLFCSSGKSGSSIKSNESYGPATTAGNLESCTVQP